MSKSNMMQIKGHIKTLSLFLALLLPLVIAADNEPAPNRPWIRPSLRLASRSLNSQNTNTNTNTNTNSTTNTKPQAALPATGSAVELPASFIVQPALNTNVAVATASVSSGPAISTNHIQHTNRTTRTADVFQNGDGFNMFVTNTCERESMRINVKTSKPFFGVIHTRNHRQKWGCYVDGTGATEYQFDVSQTMDPNDARHCGALRAPRESPEDPEIVSLVLAVRVHKAIELSDDRFFVLNCTNRCRKLDCSSPNAAISSGDEVGRGGSNGRLVDGEREGEREPRTNSADTDCTIYKFPWAVSMLWALGILCIALLISHCVICSSLVCRCVRREVEEREPSIYGNSDYESSKKHPFRIEYDNRDIYKNNNPNQRNADVFNDDDCDYSDHGRDRSRESRRHGKRSGHSEDRRRNRR